MILPTALNGRFPAAFLAVLPGRNGDGAPHTADQLAVRSYERMRRDFPDSLGDLVPTDGWSCYRTLADQARMRAQGLTTVAVGKSIHGEAGGKAAIDFVGVPFGSARHNWLKANAARYGWAQPVWARAGGSNPEAWHWEYDSARDTHPAAPRPTPTPPAPTPTEDDDVRPLFIRNRDGAVVICNGNGCRTLTGDDWQMFQNLGYAITHDNMDPGPFALFIDKMGGWQ